MIKKIQLLLLLFFFALPVSSVAQVGSLSGVITDAESQEPIPGATIFLTDIARGTASDLDGEYTLEGIPEGTHNLRVTFVGYMTYTSTIEIEGGQELVYNVSLSTDIYEMDDIVVTGLSVGTPKTKTPFAITSIRSEQLQFVPATNPANALRARAPGVRVVQASGLPGSDMYMRLRGSNNLGDTQGPLIVVDGIITRGRIQDFDMQNVESIEIIKGAAAAALYGSLAGSGVVQIITKRGQDLEGTRVTIRNEVGYSSLANKISLTEHHAFMFDELGNYRDADGIPYPIGARGIMDQPYDLLIDQQDEFFTARPFYTNFVSLEGRQGNINYMVSFENLSDGGVIDEMPDYKRRNLRANVDNQINDRLRFSLTSFYGKIDGYAMTQTGQGANVFWGILNTHPDLDLRQPGPGGEKYNPFAPISNSQNPLYLLHTRDFSRERERFMGGIHVQYDAAKWWRLDGRFSMDRTNTSSYNFIEKGTQRADETRPHEGSFWKSNSRSDANISTLRSLFRQQFGDLNVGLNLSYSYESRPYDYTYAGGGDFQIAGLFVLENSSIERMRISSTSQEVRAENTMANLTLDLKDRYIFDGVIRRDGSSLFGADERYKIYFRTAGAYRVTEDFRIPNVNELKLRASYGSSGRRPGFTAQYEVVTLGEAGLQKITAGNRNVKPADVRELELGIDIRFLDRFFAEINFASTVAKDQILLVPVSPTTGYSNQWQNVGTLESEIVEFALNGRLISRSDMNWDMTFSFDKLFRQEITELNRTPFFRRQGGVEAGLNIFRIAEGEQLGAMYGQAFARSLNELTLDESGHVMNWHGYQPGSPDNLGIDAFSINSQGYVIQQGTEYSADERPMRIVDEEGEVLRKKIGDVNPDFNIGLSSTFQYKNFTIFALFDWQQGGEVYNYTRQALYHRYRHGDMDMSGKPEGQQRHAEYFAQHLYNANAAVNEFVEDASFLKIREISLAYSFHSQQLHRMGIGNLIREAKVSVSGRNLYTFTSYSGFDPEVAAGSNATNFRVDEFTYPNFRNITMSLQIGL
ncbi:MAG: SusC/RagA family TonB-linked outer membrane protein [Balneolaceae bacterium]|nr:MAG: SusC/RagA family TonB-linked outer membrane protein [Balneolaceae bacterium]